MPEIDIYINENAVTDAFFIFYLYKEVTVVTQQWQKAELTDPQPGVWVKFLLQLCGYLLYHFFALSGNDVERKQDSDLAKQLV